MPFAANRAIGQGALSSPCRAFRSVGQVAFVSLPALRGWPFYSCIEAVAMLTEILRSKAS
jgi:hypothetical protein